MTFAVTLVFLLFSGLYSLWKEPNWSVPAISLASSELNPVHLFFEMVLLFCLCLFAEKGLELSRRCFSLSENLARARSPRGNSQPPHDMKGYLAHMNARNFASAFSPKPSLFGREASRAHSQSGGRLSLLAKTRLQPGLE